MKYKKQSLSLVLIGLLSFTQNLFSYVASDSYLMYKFGSFFNVANNGKYIAVNEANISSVQVEDLESNITLPTGATFKVYDKDSSERSSGNLEDGDYLVVTSADTTSTTTYKLYGIKPKALRATYQHTVLLNLSGEAYSFGSGKAGGLCVGTNENNSTPAKISMINGAKIVDGGGGQDYTILFDSNGKVYSCGAPNGGRLGLGNIIISTNIPTYMEATGENNITTISVNEDSTLMLDTKARVYIFGKNTDGNLGIGTDTSNQSSPIQIEAAGEYNITAISTGQNYALLLDKDGKVYGFGINFRGQLGLGDQTTRHVPTQIVAAGENNITAIVAGKDRSFLIDKNENIYVFGDADYGGIGLSENYNYDTCNNTEKCLLNPTKIETFNNIVKISSNLNQTLILNKNGVAYGAGYNEKGYLGLGEDKVYDDIKDDYCTFFEFQQITTNISDVFALGAHSIIMDTKGNFYSFGQGGQLGLCDPYERYSPTLIGAQKSCVIDGLLSMDYPYVAGLTPNVWQMVSTPRGVIVDTSTLTSSLATNTLAWAYRDGSFVQSPSVNAKEGIWIKPTSNIIEFSSTTVDTTYDYSSKYSQFNDWKCNLETNKWNFVGVEYATNWSDLTKSAITPDSGCEYSLVFNYDHDSDSWNSTDSLSKNSALYLKHICSSTPSCNNNNGR